VQFWDVCLPGGPGTRASYRAACVRGAGAERSRLVIDIYASSVLSRLLVRLLPHLFTDLQSILKDLAGGSLVSEDGFAVVALLDIRMQGFSSYLTHV